MFQVWDGALQDCIFSLRDPQTTAKKQTNLYFFVSSTLLDSKFMKAEDNDSTNNDENWHLGQETIRSKLRYYT